MTKSWAAISWVLICLAQVGVGYALAFLSNVIINQPVAETFGQFLLIPLGIWLGYIIGVYGVGMLGLALKKITPKVPGLRLLTTAILAAIPMLILIFNANAAGVENQAQFQNIIMGRMVPYYTQLCAVFALLGFYITIWWHRVVPAKEKGVIRKNK